METKAVGHICTVTHETTKYLCYTNSTENIVDICVTNAVDVWNTGFTREKFEEHKYKHGMSTLEDYSIKIREAFDHGAATLTVQDSRATVKVSRDSWRLSFDLYKLPLSESRTELQSLMFGLADKINCLGKQLKAAENAATCSPEKSPQKAQRLLMPEFDSRKRGGRGGSVTAVQKRIPGESLINPGSKRKKVATGVAFEDS
ncbi:protein PAXX [Latimeria chalumnae]|uniref:protein PAXX n=1 Tax=Latimeria chalumnae TaxID=7897 RepID=UPI0003C17C19|nr:PREDICTED: protein PAXX [Latimeria chalumnae]|eukprot:XP_005994406.1 PREDICTED: protein PAXX [Latimeria chalumnae]